MLPRRSLGSLPSGNKSLQPRASKPKSSYSNQTKRPARRLKYATAHDLRRGCAHRLINAGASAETLKVILRHKDFATTEKFYGATKAAQAAATEIHRKLTAEHHSGESANLPAQLSAEEVQKLKSLLNSL
ncbi:hypothetical protein MNBD_PLANCTO02-373 [hydrothermal vent metagenome]|uniref:Tyr recombinase domain-containing protein n=1 Tax=hydrothermal vent metagenome TaxID=652676 RepID=A0A3B1E0X5_9ZZZZ